MREQETLQKLVPTEQQHHSNHLIAALSLREEGQGPGIAGRACSSFLPLSSAATPSTTVGAPVKSENLPTSASKWALSPETERRILGVLLDAAKQ